MGNGAYAGDKSTEEITAFCNVSSREEAGVLCEAMRRRGMTPYVYVKYSLRRLAEGDYKGAFRLIECAGAFQGVYYRPGSSENAIFVETMLLLRYLILHLADEFGLIKPAKESGNGEEEAQ